MAATTATVSGIRTGIASTIGTIKGLRTAATIPDDPKPPIAVVLAPTITYDTAFGRGMDTYSFPVMVIVVECRNVQHSSLWICFVLRRARSVLRLRYTPTRHSAVHVKTRELPK